MNKSIKSRAAGATAIFAVLLASAACGSETATETDPGAQPDVEARIYPPVSVPPAPLGTSATSGTSADSAERRAAADKARAERTEALRGAQGQQVEQKLNQAGKPGRP